MKKISDVVEKAKKVFEQLPTSNGKKEKKRIMTGEGLTRTELRMLERTGFVKKIPVYKEKKFRDSPATMGYCWEWLGEK